MKLLLHFFLILLCTFVWCTLCAQKQGQAGVDSLVKELPRAKEDTNKVKLLNSLSTGYWRINPDTGIKYGQLSLELATKLQWQKGIAACYNEIGVNYLYKGDYPTALDYYLKCLKINEEIGNKKGIAGVTCNIGIIYDKFDDHPKALEYYFRALKMDEEIGNKPYTANVCGNIGIIYRTLKDYPKALDYTFRQLKIDEEIGEKIGMANAINNIGVIYYYELDYPKALEYYFKALKMDEDLGLKVAVGDMQMAIGNVFIVQKNFTMAIDYLEQAIKIHQETNDKSGIASDLTNIGDAYIRVVMDTTARSAKFINNSENTVGRFTPTITIPDGRAARLRLAVDYLQRGLAISREIHAPTLVQNCYEHLIEAYKLSGDYKKALEYEDKYVTIKDSIFSKENNDKIVKLGIKNDYDRQHLADSLKAAEKEKISALHLRRQQSYTYMGIAGILLLAGFSFFIVKERGKSENERKKSDELLLNILPGEVAKELKITGTTTAKHYDNVTVLFTDFVNFTSAGERMNPQALIDELHTCFKKFDEITARYKIEKIKTIGDAYLAVAGLPLADPKHAEHIVTAAMEINAFMQDRVAKLGERTFQIRIGIHSGSVVAGIVGVKKFAYDIWGDTVNTAARMEQSSEPGKINISETTFELVKHKFTCEYRGEIQAKNKGLLKMYYVS